MSIGSGSQFPTFSEGEFFNRISDADLSNIVSHGGPALGKSAEKPSYEYTLSKSDIEAVVSYIRAVSDPPFTALEWFMRRSSVLLFVLLVAGSLVAQIVAPIEVQDPLGQKLQTRYMAELKAIASDRR